VTASANVPPQGLLLPGTTVIKQMGKNFVTNDTLSAHLFDVQMVTIYNPDKTLPIHLARRTKQLTTPQSHDTVAMGQQLLTRSI
jgi:hypothetical protein